MLKQLILSILVLSTSVALTRARIDSDDGKWSSVVDNPQIIFSHKLHVEEEEFECLDCHGAVEASTSGLDNNLPDHDVCSDCHEVEDDETCGTCHVDPEDPTALPRIETYNRVFSHEKHLGADLECEACHAGVEQKEGVSPYILPTMVACIDCHEDQRVDTNCQTCHTPEESLQPSTHTADFEHSHGDLAANQALTATGDKTCQTCHDDDFCQDCHQGDNVDRFTHPLNFEFTHALEAQANEKDCATCHTEKQFCIDCHRDNQVLPHSHTPGWANNVEGDGGRHRIEALNDLESCMACHEQDADRVCQPCHGFN